MEKKSTTFVPDLLSYGVMVALQFLVLSVVVRIRLGQHLANNPSSLHGFGGLFFCDLSKIEIIEPYFLRILIFISYFRDNRREKQVINEEISKK